MLAPLSIVSNLINGEGGAAVFVEEITLDEAALIGGGGLAAIVVVSEGQGAAPIIGVAQHPSIAVVLEGHAVAVGLLVAAQGVIEIHPVGEAVVLVRQARLLAAGRERVIDALQLAVGVVVVAPLAPRRGVGPVTQVGNALGRVVQQGDDPVEVIGDGVQGTGWAVVEAQAVAIAVFEAQHAGCLADRAGDILEEIAKAVFLPNAIAPIGFTAGGEIKALRWGERGADGHTAGGAGDGDEALSAIAGGPGDR